MQSRTPARAALYVPDAPNNREGPQAREPSKYLNRKSYRERLTKEAFGSPATRGSKKDSGRAIIPAAEAVRVPAHLAPPGSLQAKSCATFTLNSHWGRAARGKKKSLASVRTGSLQWCRTVCAPADCGLPGFSFREGSSLGKNTGVYLANTGCHTLLEHYICCCHSCQLP